MARVRFRNERGQIGDDKIQDRRYQAVLFWRFKIFETILDKAKKINFANDWCGWLAESARLEPSQSKI